MLRGYVAKYLRISDDDNDKVDEKKESDSIANQRNIIEYYISQDKELMNYPIKEFCDDGYSGVTFKRPAFQQLLKEVRENKISCVIVKDFSRLGRNYIEVGDYLEQIFPFMGVRVISISDNYDSDKGMGGIEIGFKTLIHDLYSKDLSRKIKSVKKLHQQRGQYSGGNIPFGYKEDPQDRYNILIDEEAAKIVKMIFNFAVEGCSTGVIAKKLNDMKVPIPGAYKRDKGETNYYLKNKKKNLWSTIQVKQLLQNEAYIGTYVCHKVETIHVGEVAQLTPDKYIRHDNAHEAIITSEVFEMAGKRVVVRTKRGRYEKKAEQYVLKGKVKCGCCGYSMNLVDCVKTQYYVCRMGVNCGSKIKIHKESLEDIVLKSIQKISLLYKEKTEKKDSYRLQTFTVLSQLKEEKKILAMKQEQFKCDKLFCYREYKEGGTLEEYREKNKELDKWLEKCTARLDTVECKIKELTLGEREDNQNNVLDKITGITELTKELVEELIERIDVYEPDRVEITWRFHMEV